MQKLSAGDVQEQFGKVAHSLLGTISHRFLKVLVKHLMAVVGSLTGSFGIHSLPPFNNNSIDINARTSWI